MKISIKDFFNKCDQISSFLRIWSHLLKKSSMENFIFWVVFFFSILDNLRLNQLMKISCLFYSSGVMQYDFFYNIHNYRDLQSVTKIVRFAPPPPLFNLGWKSVCSFLVSTAWNGFVRPGTTLSQEEGAILGIFKPV